ncbi:hypothetical protein [Saccharopolyspora mangrovi]|uniref:DUF3040 domain-containing protein n=1 Tax=Saccharopolyspora mangrovi TaxID=3082379 RepID=A0ABU6AAK9_9PSEU|nr:hypothetical protein [Saccharopolyspora sp. S2-29]MEB3368540.1 hypothetical protein [Saccharopolyspora sp. S2-29]
MQRRESDEPARFGDLEDLDHDDPEVRAFAEHRARMDRPHSEATVEGMLRGVDEFAQSANRTGGHRRLVAVAVVVLILFGVLFTVWNAVGYMLGTFFG